MSYRILIINIKSTFIQIGVYEDETPLFVDVLKNISCNCKISQDQLESEKKLILKVLEEQGFNIEDFDAIISKGGILKPVKGGTYLINENMLCDLKANVQYKQISNIPCIIAYEIGKSIKKPVFMIDPIVTDELDEIAKISGVPEITRKSMFHALSQKAVARRYASEAGKRYEDINLIVAYIDNEISVGAHKNGNVIDVNNAFYGEGPFSLKGSGGIPSAEFVDLCYSEKYTKDEIDNMINGRGGLAAHLGIDNIGDIEKTLEGDDVKSILVLEAMEYQIAKEIGKCSAVLKGNVDAIILTGEIASLDRIVNYISNMVGFIAPVVVYPGNDEMLASAQGCIRVLKGEEKAREYK